jgi:L-ascorbate metabolism protein UlaG (beta-lactamase superfamily)
VRDVRVTWYGHACFRLDDGNFSLVTDPYTPELAGLQPVPEPCDVVIMSSALDEAHSCAEQVPGSPRVLNALDALERPVDVGNGVIVEGVAASEGADRPDDPKANALYRFELGGVAVCHMGDVGTSLTDAQLEPLRGRVDVLLALAGAGLTIPLVDLDAAIEEIRPTVIIPMHYALPSLIYSSGPVEDFLARRPGDRIVQHAGSSVELDAADVASSRAPTIHVLRAAGDPRANERIIA